MSVPVRVAAIGGIVALSLLLTSAARAQEPAEGTAQAPDAVSFAYTYQQPDGNRSVAGQGSVPDVEPLEIAVDGLPLWLLGAPLDTGSIWVAILDDGRTQAFRAVNREAVPVDISPEQLPPGMPPVLQVQDGVPSLLALPSPDASPLTHPVVLSPADGRLAFVDGNGDLVIQDNEGEMARLEVDALPDARLLVDEQQRILLLTSPTTRYDHGVLGDDLEAGSVTVVATRPEPVVVLRIDLVGDDVVEGIAPVWTDLSGDGKREIILTVSNAEKGSQAVVFNEDGTPLAGGPFVGQAKRWRHVVAVGRLGPEDELELVDVLTPHIGGVAEFYRLAGPRLEIVAELPGFRSHPEGSRNLDGAAIGEFDGDGRLELLSADESRRNLVAVQHTADGAELRWTVPVGGLLLTNLATVTFPDGSLAVGAGHNERAIRLWLP